jgi:hypothetical protein
LDGAKFLVREVNGTPSQNFKKSCQRDPAKNKKTATNCGGFCSVDAGEHVKILFLPRALLVAI